MRKIFYGWWIVFACFFIYFYNSGTVVFNFTAFFEPISKEFGWSYTQISIAASIRGLEFGLFAPVVGFLSDRFGARRLLFFGTATMGFGMILVSLTNSLTMYYSAFVLLSLGLSICSGPVMVPVVANWFKKDMGKALGIMSAGIGAGGLLVPVTIALISRYQWRVTYIILGVGMWVFVTPLIFVIRQKPQRYDNRPVEMSSGTQSSSAKGQDNETGFKEAIKTGAFWHIGLSDAIRLMVSTTVVTHVIPYLSSLGISMPTAAFVATAIPVLSIIGRLVFGWLGDIFDKKHVLAFIYFLTGVSVLAFAYVQVKWLIIPFLILFPLSWGAQPLRGAIMREYFGVGSLGSILGILAGIATTARILGPFLAGLTYDTFGSYQPIWLFFAIMLTAPVISMLTIKPSRK